MAGEGSGVAATSDPAAGRGAAGRSDRAEDTVDYRAVKKDVLAAADGSQYHLAEALAERVAEACLAYGSVQRVQVTVEKPGALRFAHSVAVDIDRSRG